MSFKKLSIEDIETVKEYLYKVNTKLCDYTVGTFFMWGLNSGVETDYFENTLISRYFDYEDNTYKYLLPCGKNEDIINAVNFIIDNYGTADSKLIFKYIPEEYISLFENCGKNVTVFSDEDGFDYIYDAESLRTLSGRKYSGQRNQISQFKRNVSSWEFKNIKDCDIEEVKAFYKSIEADFLYCESSKNESNMVWCVLNNPEVFGMFGGVLYANEKVAGFSLGEILNDTLYIHIEKADRNIKGSYQMVVHEFSSLFGQNVKYINREDDAGDIGLKTSKESYHPLLHYKKNGAIFAPKE